MKIAKISIDQSANNEVEIPAEVRALCTAFTLGLREYGFRHVLVLLKQVGNDEFQHYGVNATIPHELVPAALTISHALTTTMTPEVSRPDEPS